MKLTIFSGSSGLNNKVDPVRLKFDPGSGISELSEAMNIEIDQTGRVSRMKAFSFMESGEFKDICPFDLGYLLLLKKEGDSWSLVAMSEDGEVTVIRSGLSSGRMCYEKGYDCIYYSNGSERGRVIGNTSYSWEPIEYVGPDTTKEFDAPPLGHLLKIYNGRMYIAKDNCVYASEPHDYNKFDLENGYMPFFGDITMLDAVSDGMFVSDQRETYFLSGGDINDFSIRTVISRPIILGTNTTIMGDKINNDIQGRVIHAWTDYGLYLFADSGFAMCLSSNRLIKRHGATFLPDSGSGASIVINDEQLITTFRR